MERHNRAPQPELSGLSPVQAEALYRGDWETTGPLRIATDLKLAELEPARFVHNARVMLTALRAVGGTKATAQAGNLTRAFVAEMLERMRVPSERLEQIRKYNKVINEEDAWDVHLVRVVLETAGLIKKRKGWFKATRAGIELAEDVGAGLLAARLFRTFFRDFNLAYLDGDRQQPELQHLVPMHLWRIGVEGREWIGTDALAQRVLPPSMLLDPEDGGELWRVAGRLHRRVLEPLVDFGLLESRDVSPPDAPRWSRQVEMRVAPLFDRMIRFEWEN
jgi:hypothetical protein